VCIPEKEEGGLGGKSTYRQQQQQQWLFEAGRGNEQQNWGRVAGSVRKGMREGGGGRERGRG